MSPNKHQLRGPSGKYVSASQKTRKMTEGILSESKPKIEKVESDEEHSDSECYDKSNGKPVHADIDKKVTEEKKPTPNRSEEYESNKNSETKDPDGRNSLRR